MTTIRITALAAALFALAACSTQEEAAVTSGLDTAQAACTAAAPVVAAAPTVLQIGNVAASTAATVNSLLAFEQSVCASASSVSAAVSASGSGAGTATWVQNIVGGILEALPAILALV